MTMMPAQLIATDETEAIRLTLDGFRQHRMTAPETRSTLAHLFERDIDPDLAPKLIGYLDEMLKRVARDDISSEDAASDINEMAHALNAGDQDFETLLELAPAE